MCACVYTSKTKQNKKAKKTNNRILQQENLRDVQTYTQNTIFYKFNKITTKT